jgi:hypothetical protein
MSGRNDVKDLFKDFRVKVSGSVKENIWDKEAGRSVLFKSKATNLPYQNYFELTNPDIKTKSPYNVLYLQLKLSSRIFFCNIEIMTGNQQLHKCIITNQQRDYVNEKGKVYLLLPAMTERATWRTLILDVSSVIQSVSEQHYWNIRCVNLYGNVSIAGIYLTDFISPKSSNQLIIKNGRVLLLTGEGRESYEESGDEEGALQEAYTKIKKYDAVLALLFFIFLRILLDFE